MLSAHHVGTSLGVGVAGVLGRPAAVQRGGGSGRPECPYGGYKCTATSPVPVPPSTCIHRHDSRSSVCSGSSPFFRGRSTARTGMAWRASKPTPPLRGIPDPEENTAFFGHVLEYVARQGNAPQILGGDVNPPWMTCTACRRRYLWPC